MLRSKRHKRTQIDAQTAQNKGKLIKTTLKVQEMARSSKQCSKYPKQGGDQLFATLSSWPQGVFDTGELCIRPVYRSEVARKTSTPSFEARGVVESSEADRQDRDRQLVQ